MCHYFHFIATLTLLLPWSSKLFKSADLPILLFRDRNPLKSECAKSYMSQAIVHIHGLGHQAYSSWAGYLLWYFWHSFGKACLYLGPICNFLCETCARVPWPFVIVMPQTSPIAMDNTAVSHPVPCPVRAFTGGRIVCLNTHTDKFSHNCHKQRITFCCYQMLQFYMHCV